MNSEMMAKLRGLIVEAATGKCTMTAEGKACPVHGMEECEGYMQEMAPAGISDELAAKKIAAKIIGTPDLNIPKIKQYVTKYLSMVGKAPTDVTHLAALVATELENKGVAESTINEAYINTADDAIKLLGSLRAIGKKIELGTDTYEGNLAGQYVNDVWDVYSWLQNNVDTTDAKFKAVMAPVLALRGKAKGLERESGSGKNRQLGNEIVNALYPLMQWIEANAKNKVNEGKNSMPDFRDLDKDGNKKEPMKDAAKDAKAGKKSTDKKGGMTAKQAKYFGKKTAVKESDVGLKNILAMEPAAMKAAAKGTQHEGLVDLILQYVDPNARQARPVSPATTETTKSDVDKTRDADTPKSRADFRNALIDMGMVRDNHFLDPATVDQDEIVNSISRALDEDDLPSRDDMVAAIRDLGVRDKPAYTPPTQEPGSLKHHLANPDIDAAGTEHDGLMKLMKQYGILGSNTDGVEEDMHITVDGDEAQELINRLMTLAGQEGMPSATHDAPHADMCDDCGCTSDECTCNSEMTPASFGPDGLSMEEDIDNDFGHTAQSDMGEPVDPDTYTYKAPVGNQRMVKGMMGDNPLIKENASQLHVKLKKDYKSYVFEAELARSNAGEASPLTADNRDKFEQDPFVNDEPVTDGSRSPLSTIKRQSVNK